MVALPEPASLRDAGQLVMLGLGQPGARAEFLELLAQALAELDLEVGDGVRRRGGEKVGQGAASLFRSIMAAPQNGIGSSWAVPVRSLRAPCASMLST